MRKLGALALWLPPVCIVIIGVAISSLAFVTLRNLNEKSARSEMQIRVEWRAEDFEHKIRMATQSLETLARFMTSQPKADPAAFHGFAALLHHKDDADDELDWAPWVTGEDRDAFVAEARKSISADYDIRDATAEDHAVQAPMGEAYLPLLYQESFAGQPGKLGRDLLRRPEVKAVVLAARDQGTPIATPPLQLSPGAAPVLGYAVLWPVYAASPVPASVAGRRAAFQGMAIARFRLDRLLSAAIAGTPKIAESVDISIDGGSDGVEAVKVAHFDPRTDRLSYGAMVDPPAAASLVSTRQFDVLGRHWTLGFNLAPEQMTTLRPRGAWIRLFLGLALTALATAFTLREQMRRSVVEAAVKDRTADLTQEVELRRRQELALQTSASRLQAVVDTVVHGVMLTDEKGSILLFNKAAERLFGYSAAEIVGQKASVLLPPPFGDEYDRYMQDYRRTGDHVMLGIGREVAGRRKDGSTFPMELAIGEGRQDDAPIFVGVMSDVSDRKADDLARVEMEGQLRQSQKMEAIGNLTGGMAHDFNNLLTVVVGNLELIAELRPDDREINAVATEALNAALHGADLTRSLLAFARRQPLEPVEIDLNDLIADMVKLLRRLLGENIEIVFKPGPRVWAVIADPSQLQASLTNLATNARDAMPNGGRLLIATGNRQLDAEYAEVQPDVTPGDYALIEVSDSGVGMPPEIWRRIFEPFYTTKEEGKGTGLGLSMVFGFLKQSGGHVSVYSELGLGTTFRLYLPRGTVDADQDLAPVPQPAVRRASETVLVVEDQAAVRRIAVRHLEMLGYRVFEAENAAAALDVLQREKVDLLFSDVIMPGGTNGFELAGNAMERWPNLKVVLTSGFPEAKLYANEKRPIGLRLLGKPYRKVDLARALEEAIMAPPLAAMEQAEAIRKAGAPRVAAEPVDQI